MALGKFMKSPNEAKRYSIDYVNWVDVGEYLVNASITSTPSTAVNAINIDIDLIPTGSTAFSFFFFGGDSGVIYKLLVRATTNTGQIKEDTILLEVKSL
jgi:hypothetical protein